LLNDDKSMKTIETRRREGGKGRGGRGEERNLVSPK
jgi:hypothetical protein